MEEKETMETQPSRYHNAPCDVMVTQGYVCDNVFNWFNKSHPDLPKLMARVWAVGAALKHLLRCGLKDDVFCELLKAENYIHYARLGEWMPKDSK